MKQIPFSSARSSLTDIVNEVAYVRKRIVLTRRGKKIAAIVPLEDLSYLPEEKEAAVSEKSIGVVR